MATMTFLGVLQTDFFCMLEVTSYFDPFLKEHLQKHGNKGKGMPSAFIICLLQFMMN
jgi:hypothetical protein